MHSNQLNVYFKTTQKQITFHWVGKAMWKQVCLQQVVNSEN